jgi:hypothetical protein
MQSLLRQIQRQLRENNRTMDEFGLMIPAPDMRPLSIQMDDDLFPPTLDPVTGDPSPDTLEELRRDAEAAYSSLNPSQKAVVDRILQMHDNLHNGTAHAFGEVIGHNFLLSGAAGTGKTYTLNTLTKMCRALRIPVFASASTGIAATRLTGATTAHSLFGIPITEKHSPKPSSSVTGDSYKGRLLKKVRIFIIDEIGMLPVDVIKAIDKLLCFLHNVSVSEFTQFGNTIIIFTGDQRQIMPVMGRGVDPLGDEQAEASFFFSNYNSPHLLTSLELTHNMRLDPHATEFHRLQAAIGVDEVPHVAFPNDSVHQFTRYIEIPSWMARYNEMDFIREVFPPGVFDLPPMELIRRVILSSVNVDVDRINRLIVDMMPADRPSRNYLSTNVAGEHDVHNPENAIFSPEGMQTIVSPTLPYHLLELKVGTPVMCMQNLDVPNGLANGAMMVVTRLEQDVVWVMTNSRNGVVEMPIIPTVFDYDNGNGFKFSRTQLPLRIAFAVTIHRSQGRTYDVVGYHGGRPVFYHGGLFVAFTRCTTAEGFSVFVRSPSDYPRPTARNVVHPRVSPGLGFYCA